MTDNFSLFKNFIYYTLLIFNFPKQHLYLQITLSDLTDPVCGIFLPARQALVDSTKESLPMIVNVENLSLRSFPSLRKDAFSCNDE